MQVSDDMVRVAVAAYTNQCGGWYTARKEPMRAAITAALAAMWRPVEEAPDNEVVLVCGLGASGYYVADAKKIDGDWMLFSCENDEYSMESSGHTHFMPVPARPKEL